MEDYESGEFIGEGEEDEEKEEINKEPEWRCTPRGKYLRCKYWSKCKLATNKHECLKECRILGLDFLYFENEDYDSICSKDDDQGQEMGKV